jgi:hypothetical protein
VKPRTYDTPGAFKSALEDRLEAASTSGVDFARRRQLLVFDRFLARMAVAFGDAVMLKGGLVLELRLERARTTKDVDTCALPARATTSSRASRPPALSTSATSCGSKSGLHSSSATLMTRSRRVLDENFRRFNRWAPRDDTS